MEYKTIEFRVEENVRTKKICGPLNLILVPKEYLKPKGDIAEINGSTWETRISPEITIPLSLQQVKETVNILNKWLNDQK